MSWESKFPNFMVMILPNLTSDLAGNSINEPKQAKSTIFFQTFGTPGSLKRSQVMFFIEMGQTFRL